MWTVPVCGPVDFSGRGGPALEDSEGSGPIDRRLLLQQQLQVRADHELDSLPPWYHPPLHRWHEGTTGTGQSRHKTTQLELTVRHV